jgi:hypothetical protein
MFTRRLSAPLTRHRRRSCRRLVVLLSTTTMLVSSLAGGAVASSGKATVPPASAAHPAGADVPDPGMKTISRHCVAASSEGGSMCVTLQEGHGDIRATMTIDASSKVKFTL